jgi:hypothetical protein
MKTASPWSNRPYWAAEAHSMAHTRSIGLFWTSDKARLRDHLTTGNTHTRRSSMPPSGFEPTIPASERLQTHALDSAATGTGKQAYYLLNVNIL